MKLETLEKANELKREIDNKNGELEALHNGDIGRYCRFSLEIRDSGASKWNIELTYEEFLKIKESKSESLVCEITKLRKQFDKL